MMYPDRGFSMRDACHIASEATDVAVSPRAVEGWIARGFLPGISETKAGVRRAWSSVDLFHLCVFASFFGFGRELAVEAASRARLFLDLPRTPCGEEQWIVVNRGLVSFALGKAAMADMVRMAGGSAVMSLTEIRFRMDEAVAVALASEAMAPA